MSKPSSKSRTNKNLKLIIDHAHLSKLRPLTVYCIGRGNLQKVYSYDIIIPKQLKAEQLKDKQQIEFKKLDNAVISK